MKQLLPALALAFLGAVCLHPSIAAEKAADPKLAPKPAAAVSAPQVQVFTSMGNFTIELNAERAPLTVANFLAYVDAGHYTNTLIHRAVANFVVQGGGFNTDYTPKPASLKVVNESGNGLSNVRGTVGLARCRHGCARRHQGRNAAQAGRDPEDRARCDTKRGQRSQALAAFRVFRVPTLFISDLHIDAARPAIIEQFLRFLQTEAKDAAALYILGDLFESWIGDDAPDSAQAAAIAGLRALTSSGVPCFVMHGNRDFLLSRQFCDTSGAQLLPDPLIVTLYGEPVLAMHGDALCTDDRAYQRLRATVRDADWQRRFLALPIESPSAGHSCLGSRRAAADPHCPRRLVRSRQRAALGSARSRTEVAAARLTRYLSGGGPE